jgi:2-oxoacid:acceptor oxidoreductase gamma subunit (pyruvate/2-ketoisovalerate family)
LELELLMTGIGGQGIQLAAQVLARAALGEGLSVQLFGSYGGMMRGGNTEATLVVADVAIEAPPTLHSAYAAILMHHEYARSVLDRVRIGGVTLVNSSVFEDPVQREGVVVVDVPATDLAVEVGHIMTASMVMAAAFAKVTRLVSLDSLAEAVSESLPSYRTQHIALNVAALNAGYSAVSIGAVPHAMVAR